MFHHNGGGFLEQKGISKRFPYDKDLVFFENLSFVKFMLRGNLVLSGMILFHFANF